MTSISWTAKLMANPWPLPNEVVWHTLENAAQAGAAWLQQQPANERHLGFGLVVLNPCLDLSRPTTEAVLATITLNDGRPHLLAAASMAEQHRRLGMLSGQAAHELHCVGDGYAGNGSTVYRRVICAGKGLGWQSGKLAERMMKQFIDPIHMHLLPLIANRDVGQTWLTSDGKPNDLARQMLDGRALDRQGR